MLESTFPSNSKWTRGHAFACAFILVAVAAVINTALRTCAEGIPAFADWLSANSYFAQGALMLLRSTLWLVVVFFVARVATVREFVAQAGFDRRPTLSGWLMACVAVIIGFLALYGLAREWIPPNPASRGFHTHSWETKGFFLFYAVVLAPFSEEVVMRGFLYRAFRGSYGPFVSTTLVLCVHVYFHWGLISQAFYTLACLLLLEILLCYARERTGSTWNCVMIHTTYNAVQNLPWFTYVAALLLLLPYCAYSLAKKRKQELPLGIEKGTDKREGHEIASEKYRNE